MASSSVTLEMKNLELYPVYDDNDENSQKAPELVSLQVRRLISKDKLIQADKQNRLP